LVFIVPKIVVTRSRPIYTPAQRAWGYS